MVGRQFWRARSGWKAITKGRESSGGPLKEPEVVKRSSRGLEMVGSPSSRAGNCRKALTEGREWSGSNPRGPGVVGRPPQRAKSGHEAVTEG